MPTMTIAELDNTSVVRSLNETTCPSCGGHKKRGHTLCAAEYRRLPGPMRTKLYARVGRGYLEAVTAALSWLRAADQGERVPAQATAAAAAAAAASAKPAVPPAQPTLFPGGPGAGWPR